jgi:hypothetical protein
MDFFLVAGESAQTAQPLNRPFNRCRPRLTAETTGSPNPFSHPIPAAGHNARRLAPFATKSISAGRNKVMNVGSEAEKGSRCVAEIGCDNLVGRVKRGRSRLLC